MPVCQNCKRQLEYREVVIRITDTNADSRIYCDVLCLAKGEQLNVNLITIRDQPRLQRP